MLTPVRGLVRRFDRAADELFAPLRGHRAADGLFYVASEAADYSRLWHAIGLTMAAVDRSKRPHTVRLAVALGIESAIVNGALKNVLVRERPPLLSERRHAVRRPVTKSFPSGHASSACLAAVLLGDAVPRLRPLWWTLAAIVSASRVHNRMHHGSDVVGGALIGTTMGLLAERIHPLGR